ncbi:MAG: HdaA/DnaA family protein [Alphaproteobacteria bacterium]
MTRELFPPPASPPLEQLPLELPLDDRMRPEDFLTASCNRLAREVVEAWPEGADPVLVLTGPAACGKTHLARIWQARVGASWVTPATCAARSAESLLDAGPWVVDDAERLGDETLLFHLVNVARARGLGLIVVSRFAASRWCPVLADLRSRLLAAPTVAIAAPDDELLGAVLVKQFADRQLRVPPAVVHYLTARMERSFAACRRIVDLLDQRALASGRAITTALAREVLARLDGESA